ncbi:MAG: hypothetical protein IJH84_06210 [Saccharopolyspora sp.]|uniref:hypothetical protein n=1 Tax=Saccharopolyspora TaxID=1835 RepID=UPI00190995CA|nr:MULTISPECIES: hypothetical protein [unclassified Saccharopolyspora]MBK0866177.1 hypothetical protein [Saccharopolyspora sp. HNM0986]MBQ6640613.1 hypothetical protein [Saccharopolyspora sp.]
MDLHTRIELFGGPEDGREITLPAGADGAPLSPLPVPRDGSEPADETPAWYVKDHQRPHGVWVYKYTISPSVRETRVQ